MTDRERNPDGSFTSLGKERFAETLGKEKIPTKFATEDELFQTIERLEEGKAELVEALKYLKNSARAGLREAADMLTELKRGAGEASEVWYNLRQNIDKAESIVAKAVIAKHGKE